MSTVSRSQFETEVETSLKEMSRMGKDLYELLIPENARSLISGASLLYVIPTASLYGLPFEALISQHKDGQARYLLQDHAMAYLSSASLLKILQDAQSRRKETPASPLLAFAHPKYGTGKPGCFSLAKGGEAADTAPSQIRVRGYLDLMGGSLCELPETENEVRNIGTLLNAPEAALQLREKASESNVFAFHQDKELDDYRYVVFSCHGLLPGAEKTTPVNQPALALSVPDPADNNRDGFLTMAEVFGLALNADLVVLSACDTGRGDHIRGEGVRGLTRAFMYAGTPAVSVTLWPVADKSSSVLSRGFFENLEGKNTEKKKLPMAESLRQIKLDMMQGKHGKLYRHPYFWAPTAVFGIGKN
jgi:CHAT domain-containing protein